MTEIQGTFKEQYKVLETIGQGSQAKVKKIKDRKSGQMFAVKVMIKKRMDEDEVEALKTEIEIMKLVDHPNLVSLIQVFEDDKYWLLVMELMEQGDLFDLLLQKGSIPEQDVKEMAKMLIDSVRYLHIQGIIHRDIKPENVFVKINEKGHKQFMLADFGMAKLLGQQSFAETICGSPISPEVIASKPYGKECDYWSIGVLIYVMMSGQFPFGHETQNGLFEQIKNAQYSFESERWSKISDQAKDFISKILVVDPNERMNTDQMLEHPWLSSNN